MFCKSPIYLRSKDMAVKCGWCKPCTINARRILTNRILCESVDHAQSSFLTLTVDDDHMPSDGSLNKTDYVLFLKSLRENLARTRGVRLRFYVVGEYGEKTQRPHYHMALFGFPSCPVRNARVIGGRFVPCRCEVCSYLSRFWDHGNIFLGDLEADSAQYMAQYVTKKLTNNSDYRQPFYTGPTNRDRLAGRLPEFAKWSLGLGASVVDRLISPLTTYGFDPDNLPNVVLHGRKSLPMGRYLSGKLRSKLEVIDEEGSRAASYKAELQDLLLSSPLFTQDFALQFGLRHGLQSSVRDALELLNAQGALNLESRLKFFDKEKVI